MISDADYKNAIQVWEYLQMKHELAPCSAAIGLGGHDIGVAHYVTELYRKGLFPVVVFTGATSPTTAPLYPDGEANAFRELAIQHGVPAKDILTEPHATNTGQNITFSRTVLQEAGIDAESILIVSMPSMERRAYATCRKLWPEVEVLCTSAPLPFDDYISSIGNERKVIDNLVGDMQRVIEYPGAGFQIKQDVPSDVLDSYDHLVEAGYTSRMM